VEARTIRTCSLIGAALAVTALGATEPALASRVDQPLNAARTYVAARAAALSGDHARSARLLALLVDSSAADPAIARKAVSEAISAGNMQLALRLTQKLPANQIPTQARLLLAAQELRARRPDRAVQLLAGPHDNGDIDFLNPFITGWAAADRGDQARALAALASIPQSSALAGAKDEHLALVLLKLGKAAQAEPFAQRAIENAGGREQRLRLAFADGFLAADDRGRAMAMLEGVGADAAQARQRIEAGRRSGLGIDSAAGAFSELLLRLAVELNQISDEGGLPVGVAQVARYAAPDNDSAALLLGILLESRGRVDDALVVLRSVEPGRSLAGEARDIEVRALVGAEKGDEALAVARSAASVPGAGATDFARLGDVLSSLDRHDEAALAYRRGLQLTAPGRPQERWPLYLLLASSLEQSDRWPEAKAALSSARALAPDQPLILNFLGYAMLERGEDLDMAEAMIRKASQLAPDDASITDSLGWALYKRGRLDEAIDILQRAARGDPVQAEIQEHLGDALYRAGRKYEARFAWQAALTTAEDDIIQRIGVKLERGLTAETAAP
jgi:tetratricopeptide (TPR) repeat protein